MPPSSLERREKILCSLEKGWKGSWILTLTFQNKRASLQGPVKPQSLGLLQPRDISAIAPQYPWHWGSSTWGSSPGYNHLSVLGRLEKFDRLTGSEELTNGYWSNSHSMWKSREGRHLCLCTMHFSLGGQGFSRACREIGGRSLRLRPCRGRGTCLGFAGRNGNCYLALWGRSLANLFWPHTLMLQKFHFMKCNK